MRDRPRVFALQYLPVRRFVRSGAALVTGISILCGAHCASAVEPPAVDFTRDVRPILSNYCFPCHGPDEETREAGLRLDTFEGAQEDLGGYQAIEPHAPEQSALVERTLSTDPYERMPPEESGLELSPQQIELLRAWIAQGAAYDQHWAFRPITRPPVPAPGTSLGRNPVDAFIQRRLREPGITPSPEADRPTLIRRVYLDLLGLPPAPEAVRAFVQDESPGAYNAMLDRVLADPHYGERWGRHWLDQARYADTNGYTVDSERTMWPYRDWVIQAINADMPFDQFTIEQLAGDLLPDPAQSQLVATGFHRNTLVNQEGGVDQEQFRNEAVVDRVNTTGAVWLGLTVGCAQCHTHKFDPLTHHEYYQLFAFFNSSEDSNSISPTIPVATSAERERLAELDREIAAATAAPHAQPWVPEAERAELARHLERLREARQQSAEGIRSAMIMRERPTPRQTHVLVRGDFLRPGDPVEPNVPAVLPPLPESDAPRNRLDLARWLVDGDNPLVARVVVNRIWMRMFGRGLVETENDFGLQGTPPTHPELLDWLAADLIEQGWSIKHLHRLIASSATYRQSSRARPDAERTDPLNKLLARQTRLRVDAEIVRDLAIAASGQLDHRIGGPSVHPPQPDGVYAFTQRGASWPTSTGGDRYRRGMYTFFMRSAPYPMLTTFDTPGFNTTCTQRVRSNTPLQSLTMANAEAMVEAARGLGKRILGAADTDRGRIDYAYHVCFSRSPTADEAAGLLDYLADVRQTFGDAPEDARTFTGGHSSEPLAAAELAAWTALGRVLLNLDEFITRE